MQDSKMQIKAEATQLCKMLSKPHSQRMPFQGVEIAKSLQRIPLMSKFFDMKSQQFITMCISSSIIQFQQNSDAYLHQTERYIYIILEGKVKVTLKNEENQIFEQGKHYLSEFGIFGATEILFGLQSRKQRITAESSIVKCMVFEQSSILKILNPPMSTFMQKSLNYLQVNEYFQQLSQFQKQQLVIQLSLESFSTGDHIVESQTLVSRVYFIVYGRVSVVKELLLDKDKKQKYKIDELSEMNSFGEYECQNKKMSEFVLVAQTNGAYYWLDYQMLKQANHRILQVIRQKAIPYPDDEELGFLHTIKNTLKKEQRKIVKKNHLF